MAVSKVFRTTFVLHPVTERLHQRLADHFHNSRQGVLGLAVDRFDPANQVTFPDGKKSASFGFDASAKVNDLLRKHVYDLRLPKSEVLRRAIHQLAEAEGLA